MGILAAGCTEPRTEVVVVVHSYGLTIGRDLDGLQIIVKNSPTADDSTALFATDRHPLCDDSQQPACWTLPVTATLVPGPDRPNDLVVVKVLGLRGGNQIIGDQASFHFLKHVSQRLDFVLYANCLNVDCTNQNAACNYAGECEPIQPMTFTGEPQLDGPPANLLPDMLGASTTDLAGLLPDLVGTPADLTGFDLTGVDLQSTDLNKTDLQSTDLNGTDLQSTDLNRTDLQSTDLNKTDLQSTDLNKTDLQSTDLAMSDLGPSAPPGFWNKQTLPGPFDTRTFRGVWGISALELWAVGDAGSILYTQDGGNTWVPDVSPTSPPTSADLFGVAGGPAILGGGGPSGPSGPIMMGSITNSEIYAVGNGGVVMHRVSAGNWAIIPTTPFAGSDLRAVSVDDSGNVWVVGTGGNGGVIYFWDGTDWHPFCGSAGSNDALHTIWYRNGSAPQAWVAGIGGNIRPLDVAIACPSPQPTALSTAADALNGISGTTTDSTPHFFAAGAMGTVFRCPQTTGPSGCIQENNTGAAHLFAVWTQGDGHLVFATGAAGAVLSNRSGAADDWTDESGFTSTDLFGVWSADGTGTAWAAGAGGEIWRRN